MTQQLLNEIEVLASIYGESVVFEDGNVKYDSQQFSIVFFLPPDYPSMTTNLKWKYTSKLTTMPSTDVISIEIEDIIENNRGSEVLFQIIECIRSKAQETIGLSANITDMPTISFEEDNKPVTTNLRIFHGDIIVERKSSFQPHFAVVKTMEEVYEFRNVVLSDKKIARATHNIFAYRFTNPKTGVIYHDYDDDGETAAGGRLVEMLRLMSVDGVAVIVSRWFGGTLLGPDRFKLICNSARTLLESHGYGIPKK